MQRHTFGGFVLGVEFLDQGGEAGAEVVGIHRAPFRSRRRPRRNAERLPCRRGFQPRRNAASILFLPLALTSPVRGFLLTANLPLLADLGQRTGHHGIQFMRGGGQRQSGFE